MKNKKTKKEAKSTPYYSDISGIVHTRVEVCRMNSEMSRLVG